MSGSRYAVAVAGCEQLVKQKCFRHFVGLLITYFLTATFVHAGEAVSESPAKEISAIETLLGRDQFDEGRKLARDSVKTNPQFAGLAAYVSVVVGHPAEALTYLASESQKQCAGLVDNKEELKKSEDYSYAHCYIHWALRTRAHFAMKNWREVVQSVEMLELVSVPNPIYFDLVLYILARKISSFASPSLDVAVLEMIRQSPTDITSKLALAISDNTEWLHLDNVTPNDFAITLVGVTINAALVRGKSKPATEILETLKRSIPAKLDGPNMDIGLLRGLINTRNIR